MTSEPLLWTPAETPRATLLLAHGAGAGMSSPFMDRFAESLAGHGVTVARFEFGYMAARRQGGPRRPPPKAERLIGEYEAALKRLRAEVEGPLLIGGKSMGGRVAAMVSADPDAATAAAGVVCLGYPFHPTGGTHDNIRLEPLQHAGIPVLICQGDRDPFGNAAEIAEYGLPETVRVAYLEDGDHDFKPRGRSPATWKGNLAAAARRVADFAEARLAEGGAAGRGPRPAFRGS